MTRLQSLLTSFFLAAVSYGMQSGNNAVVPGEFIVEPPTLINLEFEWKIQGDDNRNATVAVQYRKKGQSEWREALPLLRIGDESVESPGVPGVLDAASLCRQHSRPGRGNDL